MIKSNRIFLAFAIVFAFAMSFSFMSFTYNKKENFKDILKELKAINGSDRPKPSREFKKGVINNTTLHNYLHQTKNGFVIQLPSKTNIPTPVVEDGKLFVSGGFGSKEYFAFDAKNGGQLWAVTVDDDGPSSGVIEDDVLVFNTESCTIFACDKKTGKMLWSYWLGDPLMSMPTVANGKVFTAYPKAYAYGGNYSGGQDHYGYGDDYGVYGINNQTDSEKIKPSHVLAAFDLKTGEILWQKWIDGDIMSAPVAKGDDLYFTTFSGSLCKVSQKDGEFEMGMSMRATSAPVIDENGLITLTCRSDKDNVCTESIVVVNDKDASIETQYMDKQAAYLDKKVQDASGIKTISNSLDAGNGFGGGAPASANWESAYNNIGQSNVSSLQSFQGSRILSFNNKNYNTMGDELVCSDPLTGKVVWNTKIEGDLKSTGGFLAAPPIKAGDYLVIATYGGEVQVIDAATGKINERYFTGDHIRYQPLVVEGWIYVTTTTGKLMGFDTKNPKLTGWGMWGANAAHTNIGSN